MALIESEAAEQICKTRIIAKGVEVGMCFQERQRVRLFHLYLCGGATGTDVN